VRRRVLEQAYLWVAGHPSDGQLLDLTMPDAGPVLRLCDGGSAFARTLDQATQPRQRSVPPRLDVKGAPAPSPRPARDDGDSRVRIVRVGDERIGDAVALHQHWLDDVPLIDTFAHPTIWPMHDDDVLLLAVDDAGEAIGFLFGNTPHDDDGAGHLWLLVVAEPWRRRGVGRALVRQYALLAEQAGTHIVWVDPVEGPQEAELIQYYTALGWTDRTGFLNGHCERRNEQMHGTVASILAAVGCV
jgi:GNAT superfamily N-acetyltransferase